MVFREIVKALRLLDTEDSVYFSNYGMKIKFHSSSSKIAKTRKAGREK